MNNYFIPNEKKSKNTRAMDALVNRYGLDNYIRTTIDQIENAVRTEEEPHTFIDVAPGVIVDMEDEEAVHVKWNIYVGYEQFVPYDLVFPGEEEEERPKPTPKSIDYIAEALDSTTPIIKGVEQLREIYGEEKVKQKHEYGPVDLYLTEEDFSF